MDSDRYTHQHMLGSLNNFTAHFEKIRSLKCLKAKEVVPEVTLKVDDLLDPFSVVADDFMDVFCE